ncbi:DUF1275 domain-containing protein [Azoarcus sp. L1K30]|uniref:YoaK family protein n=1 Tax=Azoarcus sp. L1K30 TaxID=2820277 RepID=UPI001B8216BC|nr:YoaK family protein [Azoarcus sp. L1K30]MBR0566050.1 DUF1275 domain-containing protein [Azoarcus sp. L1K30]
MKPSLPVLLSANGGYVDTAGFLALHGLFTAHVTGNFVTLGAALALGTSGTVGKLMALPVFCIVVMLVRMLGDTLAARGHTQVRPLLVLQFLLLTAGCALAIVLGPFEDADHIAGLITGMTLICGMAVQNAVHRIHLPSAPPSTLMTGTTTQIMIDLADLVRGAHSAQATETRARLMRMSKSLGAFALGCGAAALIYAEFGMWCFAVPVLIALTTCLCADADVRTPP